MIARLRRRFVLLALASMALVLAAILVGVNLVNRSHSLQQLDERCDLIVTLGGSLDALAPGAEGPAGHVDATWPPALRDDDADDDDDLDDADNVLFEHDEHYDQLEDFLDNRDEFLFFGGRRRPLVSAETPFDTRYFSVILDAQDEAAAIDVSHIAAVSADDAAALAQTLAAKSDGSRGLVGDYRYVVRSLDTADSRRMLVFVDAQRELNELRSFAVNSAGIALLGLAAVTALLVPLSARVVRPFVQSHERQKRFVTDASHELKTPLAIISSDIDVIELEQGQPSEWTQSVRNQVTRLTELTQKLVALSKADEGIEALTISDFDLAASAEKIWGEFVPVATASGRSLERDIDQPLTCHADQILVEEVISLLLDNALKYSDEQGTVRLSVHGRGHGAEIAVWNTLVPGTVEPGSHPEFFERFYRADESRASRGHGIGLAVVRAVAEAHHGSVNAHSKDGASIEFVVRM